MRRQTSVGFGLAFSLIASRAYHMRESFVHGRLDFQLRGSVGFRGLCAATLFSSAGLPEAPVLIAVSHSHCFLGLSRTASPVWQGAEAGALSHTATSGAHELCATIYSFFFSTFSIPLLIFTPSIRPNWKAAWDSSCNLKIPILTLSPYLSAEPRNV
jgi:hypothetical protein